MINTHSFVGVLDGASTPYSLVMPPINICSMSSGSWVARTVETFFTDLSRQGASLFGGLIRANQAVERGLKKLNLNHLDSGMRPGAAFALVGLGSEVLGPGIVEVAQVGDSFVVVLLEEGRVVTSPYRMRGFEKQNREIVDQKLLDAARSLFGCRPDKVPKNRRWQLREDFWKRYVPLWVDLRSKAINNTASLIGYGLLNGESRFAEFIWCDVFLRKEVKTILCLTNGMIPKSLLSEKDDEVIAKSLLQLYADGGWTAVLQKVREEEKLNASMHYIDHAEASGYALEF